METVLLVVQVLICIALIVVVLIQRSDTDGFGLGSGSGANLLSGRGTANLLTRTTAILAGLFMVNSLLLSVIVSQRSDSPLSDLIQSQQHLEEKAKDATPAVPGAESDAPSAPDATSVPAGKPAVPEAN